MIEKTIQTTVYEATDGKQFLSQEECYDHEKLLDRESKIKFFKVWHSPDLNETGYFTNYALVAVEDVYNISAESLVTAWAINTYGYTCPGVQGCGVNRAFSICEGMTKEQYLDQVKINKSVYHFFAKSALKGFPPHWDYYKYLCNKEKSKYDG